MKKLGTGLVALLLAASSVLLGAQTASAHTSNVTGVAVCETDGTYTVQWTYKATNVPKGVEAETKAMTTSKGSLAPIDGVDKGGQIFLSVWSQHQVNVPGAPVKTGNWTGKFKTVGVPGDFKGSVTTMVQTDWLNGPSEDPVGSVDIPGDCKVKEYPPVITPAAPDFTTAPTCDTDGTYVLPEGPAAQNHNPENGLYGVELDGYHLYVRNTTGEFGGPGVYTWDAYGIGANGNEDYPLGTSVGGKVDGQGNPKAGGKVSGSFEVLPATDDCPVVVPPKPEDKVTKVTTSDKDCDSKTYTETVTVTTIGYRYDEETNTWIELEAVETATSSTRATTEGECPTIKPTEPPVEPEEPVTPTEPEKEIPTKPNAEKPKAPTLPMPPVLAETGGNTDIAPLLWIGGGIIVIGGGLLTSSLLMRPRKNHN